MNKKKFLIVVLSLVLITSIVFIGCKSGKESDNKTKKMTYLSQTLESKQLKVGDNAMCPVMDGNKFTITDKTPKKEYKGKTYYFCCSDCLKSFNKDPEKYLKAKKK